MLFYFVMPTVDVTFVEAMRRRKSQDFETAAELAEKYGCEAVEIVRMGQAPHQLSDDEINQVNNIAVKHNLKICAIVHQF